MTVALTTGMRLRSQVCDTEVIVVRPPGRDLVLTCGGAPLIGIAATAGAGLSLDPALAGGALLGKRYTSADEPSLEVLVTKGGDGTLAEGRNPLVLKEARPLPASD